MESGNAALGQIMAMFEQSAAMLGSWLGGFSPKASTIGNLGDFFFFRYILGYLSDKIHDLGFDMLVRVSQFAGYLALIVLTLYIFFQGYRVVTGQLRESMMGLVSNMAKAAFIVAVALSFGVLGSDIHGFLVNDMRDGIHELVTGNTGSPEEEIDDSLGWLQVAMSSIDLLEAVNDPDLVSEKESAKFYVGIGTGGPAITAGAMLLLYEIAMALFIGLGPIFILSLLFDFTKGLFQKWLFYGIGTMFSMAMLSAMVSIALDMVTRVSGAMWASSAMGQLLLGDNVVGGMSSMAMQQGGMGLILTTLIITAPPMAAMFFNGVMGQFSAYATVGAHLTTAQPQMGAYSGGGPGGGYGGGYQPTMPGRMGETARTERDQMGDFHAAQAAQAPMYSTGPGRTASNTSPSPSGLGPGTRGAGNTLQQSAPIDTPTSPAGTEARGSQANYAPENPGARGSANAAPAGAPQYTPPPSSGGAPTPAPSQNAPPVSSPTRVAGSPSTQTPGPTYTPPPPPKDRG